MKLISIYITLFLLLISGMVQSQEELNSYLITAAENNPGLKSRFNDYMAAMEKVPQVGALPDPVLAFGYFVSPVETRVGPQQFVISASQKFPWFGLLNAKEDFATEVANSRFEIFEEARSKLFYDVKSAYYNLYFIIKGIDITQENIVILYTFKQLALIKFEAGKASAVDELRVEMEIADLENQLAYLQDRKYEMQVRFNNLLNVDDRSNIIVPDTLWEDPLALSRFQLMDSIAINNHLVKQIEHRILSWENEVIVARKTGLPDFSIGIDYAAIGKSNNPNLDPSENGRDVWLLPKVGISIPLYRKKYKALVKEASFRVEGAKFEREDQINALSSFFEIGYKDFRDGERRVKLYIEQLRLSEQALDILLAEYSTDGKNFEEVLRMERKVLKYDLELDKAKSDRNAAVAFINYLMGK
jgi:outer membrane protein, heavy metal efflux system